MYYVLSELSYVFCISAVMCGLHMWDLRFSEMCCLRLRGRGEDCRVMKMEASGLSETLASVYHPTFCSHFSRRLGNFSCDAFRLTSVAKPQNCQLWPWMFVAVRISVSFTQKFNVTLAMKTRFSVLTKLVHQLLLQKMVDTATVVHGLMK